MSSNFDSNVNGNSDLKRNSFGDDVTYRSKDINEHIPSIIDNVPIYEENNSSSGCASFDSCLPSWGSIIFVFTYGSFFLFSCYFFQI